jgi:hypothetical protein
VTSSQLQPLNRTKAQANFKNLQHLKDNFTTKFSRTLKPIFWLIVKAVSISRFNALIKQLRAVNNDAADYLLASDPTLWSVAHFNGTRFGHLTSNIVETVNRVLKLDRELPITLLLAAIWDRVMDTRFKRLEMATTVHKAETWTPWARGKLQEHRLLA